MILAATVLFIFSLAWFIWPPHKINNIWGYRTSASKKSINHWKLANALSSRLFLFLSIIMLIESLLINYYLTQANESIIFVTFVLGAVVIIYVTENKLKKLK